MSATESQAVEAETRRVVQSITSRMAIITNNDMTCKHIAEEMEVTTA